MNEFTLSLDEQDLAVIAAGLGELPLKLAKPTFDKINSQVSQQAVALGSADQGVGECEKH